MPQDLPTTSPTTFGLESFADLLPVRDPIPGEDPGSFATFHAAMMASLGPATPYECVIAENLVAIEWELAQHRRMRDAGLRDIIRRSVSKAVVRRKEAEHEAELDEEWERHVAAGGDEDDWKPRRFDRDAAEAAGEDLAVRAMTQDLGEQARAYEEVRALGMDPVEIMGEAYRSRNSSVTHHDGKLRELEGRRREVKRDFDALQRARPVEATVI
ncbi:hypothetical protein ACROSR_13985 [Roseovarius tibetensis]|uniref:hypothetical protein n=1 Tax=Roseovarius tibetensis TaxID=2685897 RepID=UPI003D7F5C27